MEVLRKVLMAGFNPGLDYSSLETIDYDGFFCAITNIDDVKAMRSLFPDAPKVHGMLWKYDDDSYSSLAVYLFVEQADKLLEKFVVWAEGDCEKRFEATLDIHSREISVQSSVKESIARYYKQRGLSVDDKIEVVYTGNPLIGHSDGLKPEMYEILKRQSTIRVYFIDSSKDHEKIGTDDFMLLGNLRFSVTSRR